MAILAKPTAYVVNTGATLCPNHLWMIDEGSGTSLADKGKTGGKTLTIVGADWTTDGTHGQTLNFVSANSDYAHRTETGSEPVMGITTAFSIVLVFKIAAAPAATQGLCGVADSGAPNVYYSGGISNAGPGRQQLQVRNTTALSNGIAGNNMSGNVWQVVIYTFGDSTQSGSLDGAGYGNSTLAANINDPAIDMFALGVRPTSAPLYGDIQIAAAGLYVNTELDSTQQANLYNSGDVWTAMGVTASTGQKGAMMLAGIG